MTKVITFSRNFQKSHPRAGEPTFFVEKIWCSDFIEVKGVKFYQDYTDYINKVNSHLPFGIMLDFVKSISTKDFEPKFHTIRSGHRFKVGDKFSPRVWSGKPYASKQIVIAPDIEVKQVFDFEIDKYKFIVCGKLFYHQHVSEWHCNIEKLSQNDGLTVRDLFDWFEIPCSFKGQIICWNDSIQY